MLEGELDIILLGDSRGILKYHALVTFEGKTVRNSCELETPIVLGKAVPETFEGFEPITVGSRELD